MGIGIGKLPSSIRNVDLTDAEYDDFQRIAGRMTKMRLDAIIPSPDFQRLHNHEKHDIIKEVVKRCRNSSREMMMMKYPHIPRDATLTAQEAIREEDEE